jgi:hypothetical protein
MTEIGIESLQAGRANTVLVFGQGDSATAVISTVIALVRKNAPGKRIRFIGPVIFEKKTAEHIEEVVLPAADNILRALNLPGKTFDISVVNLDAASLKDVGLNISGFSADVPVLLAILSASLQMAVSEDIVSTGHVASPDGDIRMVKNLPAKLEAAMKAEPIKRFIHPAVAEENPLDFLSPGERQSAVDALAKAKRDITTIGVRDIGELIPAIFSDEQTVLASLRQGFYMISSPPAAAETASRKAIQYLAQNNEKRFWAILGHQLLEGRTDDAKGLMFGLSQWHINIKTYPKGLGRALLGLIQSLPPETRRLKLDSPLLPVSECIQLSQFAKESDHEDVPLLFRAGTGEKTWPPVRVGNWTQPGEGLAGKQEGGTLQAILSEISAEALTNMIGLPIDSARAAYIMESVTVSPHEDFNNAFTSFYLHLVRHTRRVSNPVDFRAAAAEALGLLERAFSKRGGFKAALDEGRTGINGGLRLVLDMMTEQFKREEQEKHINRVFKTALDPKDWEGRVELMGALLKNLEPHLGPEIVSQPPSRFAEHYEEIIRAYLQSLDRLKSLLGSL